MVTFFSLTQTHFCSSVIVVCDYQTLVFIHSPGDGGCNLERCQSYQLLLQQQLYWGQWVWKPSRIKIFYDAGTDGLHSQCIRVNVVVLSGTVCYIGPVKYRSTYCVMLMHLWLFLADDYQQQFSQSP